MAESDVPRYTYKIALGEDVVMKSMVKLLADYNIHDISEEKALRLFYSILAHFMYHLEQFPGHYFHLKYIDITNEGDDFITVKRNNDYIEDTVTPSIFYDKFCGTQMLKEELEKSLDLFAKALVGVKEDKDKEAKAIAKMIARREALLEEIEGINSDLRTMKKQVTAKLIKQRQEYKEIKRHAKKLGVKVGLSNLELNYRKEREERFQALIKELRQLWEEDNTQLPFLE